MYVLSEFCKMAVRRVYDVQLNRRHCHAHTNRTQLINHGVPDDVIGNLMRDVAEFFDLPLEAKKECAQQVDSLEGYGQSFVVS